MKKALIIISTLVIMFIILLVLMGITKGEVKEITFKEYMTKIENKESFILYIGSSDCSHCFEYSRTLGRVIKNHEVTFYYVDIKNFNQEEINKLKSKVRYEGTPTTAFIVDGEEKSTYQRIVGSEDYDYIINRLKETGYIKGGK